MKTALILAALVIFSIPAKAETVNFSGESTCLVHPNPLLSCETIIFDLQITATAIPLNLPLFLQHGPDPLTITNVTGTFNGQAVSLITPANGGLNGYWNCFCYIDVIGGPQSSYFLPLGSFLELNVGSLFADSNGETIFGQTAVTAISSAPEPSTFTMLTLGLIGLFGGVKAFRGEGRSETLQRPA